jgi:putative sterol carrier protein
VAPVTSQGTRGFFEGLETRADAAKLAGLDHTYRFEIDGEGVWSVRIQAGTVEVTEGGTENGADATIRTSSEVFERLISGRQNPTTAYMSGKVKVDGDLGAVLKLQRLFG